MVQINFGVSNYVRNAPGVRVEDTIMEIPESGKLEGVKRYPTLSREEDTRDIIPKRRRMYGFPTVALEKPDYSGTGSYGLWMMWIWSRREWVAIYHCNWLESDAWGNDDSYSG